MSQDDWQQRQHDLEQAYVAKTISGHPVLETENLDGKKMNITLCSECGSVRSVLYLSTDRWFCTTCRSTGDARPTQIAFSNPARRK